MPKRTDPATRIATRSILTAEEIKRMNDAFRAIKRMRKGQHLSTSLTPKCIAYTRVSTREQADHGFSLAAQEHAAKALFDRLKDEAERNRDPSFVGVEWGELLCDAGVSAFTKPILQRKNGSRLATLNPGDHLIFVAQDRGFRDQLDALSFLEYVARPKNIHIHIPGWMDPLTPMGKVQWSIMAMCAEMESSNKSARIRAVIEHRRATAQALPGQTPVGLKIISKGKRRVYAPDEDQLRDMAEVCLLRQKGLSWPEISREMALRQAAEQGVPPDEREKLVDNPFKFRRFWGRMRCARAWKIVAARCAEVGASPTVADPYRVLGVSRLGEVLPSAS